MATYREIQDYVKQKHGQTVKTCWIAHVKEICGLKPRVAPNRSSPSNREHPCPPDKILLIEDAFRHFSML